MAIIPVVIRREEDELLYSWLLRLSDANGFSNGRSFVNAFITPNATTSEKRRRVLKYDLLEDFEDIYVALSTKEDKLKLFINSSIFSYYAPFLTRDQQAGIINETFINNGNKSDISVTRTKMISELRLCPKCMEEDTIRCGRWYYHRAHQLPGVCTCSKHHIPLRKYSGIPMHEIEDAPYTVPVEAFPKADEVTDFSDYLLNTLLNIASGELKSVLIKKISHMYSDDALSVRNEYLRYFGGVNDEADFDRLWKALYSERYLDPVLTVRLCVMLYSGPKEFEEEIKGYNTTHIDINKLQSLNCHLYGRESNVVVEVRHSCGAVMCISPIELTNGWKCPYCESARDALEPSRRSPTEWDENRFIQEIYDLTGDEYTLLGSYAGMNTGVSIKHNKCGKVQRYKPAAFLDGSRCKYCNEYISENHFKRIVSEVSLGRYEVTSKRTENLYTITDTSTGRRVDLSKAKILQELRRPTSSELLPLDAVGKEPDNSTAIATTERWITENCQHGVPIFLEDIDIEGIPYPILKKCVESLCKQKKILKFIAPGIYMFAEDDISDDCIVEAKYLVRNGKRIGYPIGSNALYLLGIIRDKPDEYRVVTNKETSKNVTGRTKTFLGHKLRIHGSEIWIDESNWKILMVLDTVVNLRKYLHGADYASAMVKLIEFVKSNNLTPVDFSQYQGKYVFSYNAVRSLFKE